MPYIRVINGIYKKKKVFFSLPVRPTQHKTKKKIFDILMHAQWSIPLKNSHVMDAYAGSGGMGIEFLSCGAQKVLFCEKNPKTCQNISKNLDSLNINEKKYQVICKPTITHLKRINQKYEFIFIDAPYTTTDQELSMVCKLSYQKSLITILETNKKKDFINKLKHRVYPGKGTWIYFLISNHMH